MPDYRNYKTQGSSRRTAGRKRKVPSKSRPVRRVEKTRLNGSEIKKSLLSHFFKFLIRILESISDLLMRIKNAIAVLDPRTKLIAMSTFAITVFIVIGLTIVINVSKPNGWEIFVNESSVGKLEIKKNESLNEEYILEMVIKKIEAEQGEKVQLSDTIKIERVKDSEFDTVDNLIAAIIKKVSYKIEAAIIIVDGSKMGIVKNKSEADNLLETIKREYYQENLNILDDRTSFVENVEVISEYVELSERMSYNDVFELLTSKTLIEDYYIIKSRDTLSTIAANFNMTQEGLLAMNPGYTPQTVLQIGKQLKITVPKPVLSVKTIEEVTSPSTIVFTSKKINNDNQPKSYSKVLQQGSNGQEEIVKHIIRVNGSIVSEEIVNRRVIVPAVDEIIEIGTK